MAGRYGTPLTPEDPPISRAEARALIARLDRLEARRNPPRQHPRGELAQGQARKWPLESALAVRTFTAALRVVTRRRSLDPSARIPAAQRCSWMLLRLLRDGERRGVPVPTTPVTASKTKPERARAGRRPGVMGG